MTHKSEIPPLAFQKQNPAARSLEASKLAYEEVCEDKVSRYDVQVQLNFFSAKGETFLLPRCASRLLLK